MSEIRKTFLLVAALAVVSGAYGEPAWSLTCGETVTGTVPTGACFPQCFDTLSFDAAAGDVVALSFAAAQGFPIQPLVKLFVTGGSQVALNFSNNFCSGVCVSASLPTEGSYTIQVWESGQNQTGDYNLTLESVAGSFDGASNGPPNPTCQIGTDGTQSLSCGEIATRQIDVRGESDTFTFDALENEAVTITTRAAVGSPIRPLVKLYRPDGVQVPLNLSNNFCGDVCTSQGLPSSGTYTVAVWDQDLNQVGNYNINLEAISATFNGTPNGPTNPACQIGDDGTQPLGCGSLVTRQIDLLGESDTFTFDAAPGEVLTFTAAPAGSAIEPVTRLFTADGSPVLLNGSTFFCTAEVCTSEALPGSGSYTLEVFDGGLNETGAYNLTLETVSGTFDGAPNGPTSPPSPPVCADTQVMTCGQTLEAQDITAPGDPDTFTFRAFGDDIVTITAAPATGSPVETAVRLFAPGGGQVQLNGSLSFCVGIVCTSSALPLEGTYTIEVFDGSNDESGSYNITLQALSGSFNGASTGPPTPICSPQGMRRLLCGLPVQGSISVPGDADAYTFLGELGDVMRVSLNELSAGFQRSIRLFGPGGTQLQLNGLAGFCQAANCDSEPLPSDGTYTVEVFDSFNDGTGDYEIILQELDGGGGPLCQNDCNNGIDDDADGTIDYKPLQADGDRGCSWADDFSELHECSDNVDNDRDGLADFVGGDAGCRDAEWLTEDPQCEDNQNNDADGLIDWDGAGIGAPDSKCTVPYKNSERCGLGLELALLLPVLMWLRQRRVTRAG